MTLSTARSNRLRRSAILAGSIAAHGLVLVLLAFPRIEPFIDQSTNEDALTVTLERPERAPETEADAASARASNAIQARTPRAIFPSPVAPLVLPSLPAHSPRATAFHPAPLPEGPKGDLRSALRGSGVGCANEAAVGLNRREIERCHERWDEAARKAPIYANAPLSTGATAEFAQQAARQEANRRYKASPMGPGVDHRNHGGPGPPKEIPFVMGDTDGLGRKKSNPPRN